MNVDRFNHTIDLWISELDHYSFKDLVKIPAPGSWSLGQVYMHIVDETQFFIHQMEECLTQNKNSNMQMHPVAADIFANNEFPNEKLRRNPGMSVPGQPGNKAEIQIKLKELKEEMNAVWEKIKNSRNNSKANHPALGYFNAKEWFQFSEMHLRHHFRQKERIDEFLNRK